MRRMTLAKAEDYLHEQEEKRKLNSISGLKVQDA